MTGLSATDDAIPKAVSREPFSRRLSRLAAHVVRTRVVTAKAHPPIVSFTFDDVPASAAECGAAILERAGRRGTFYLAGGLIGAGRGSAGFATPEQCLALHRAGHEIGCHTHAHVPVSAHGASALGSDLDRNASFLRSLDPAIRISSFAYPYNHTSLRAKWQIERRYESCRGGVPGINAGRIDLGFLRAVRLSEEGPDGGSTRDWIARAAEQGGWLIFFTHGIEANPDPYGCRPELLRSAIDQALDLGCVVAPVREAMRLVVGAMPSPRETTS